MVIGFAKSIFTDTSLSDKQVSAGIEFQLLIQFLLYVFDVYFPVCTYAYEVECTKHGIIDFLFLKDINWLKSLAIGDYKMSFGQGLVISNDFSPSRTAVVAQAERRTNGFRRHFSTNEQDFFRGVE